MPCPFASFPPCQIPLVQKRLLERLETKSRQVNGGRGGGGALGSGGGDDHAQELTTGAAPSSSAIDLNDGAGAALAEVGVELHHLLLGSPVEDGDALLGEGSA